MSRIYIAGKITGLEPEEAEANFVWGEQLLERAGHTPLNPLKLVDQCDSNEDGTLRTYGEQLADALRVLLTQAEGVYFLDNWQVSKGATIEHFIASMLSIPQYYQPDELPIGSDWPEVKL